MRTRPEAGAGGAGRAAAKAAGSSQPGVHESGQELMCREVVTDCPSWHGPHSGQVFLHPKQGAFLEGWELPAESSHQLIRFWAQLILTLTFT